MNPRGIRTGAMFMAPLSLITTVCARPSNPGTRDETDSGRLHAGPPKEIGDMALFFANYTNESRDSLTFTVNAKCNVYGQGHKLDPTGKNSETSRRWSRAGVTG